MTNQPESIRFDYNNMMSVLCRRQEGFTDKDLDAVKPLAAEAFQLCKEKTAAQA